MLHGRKNALDALDVLGGAMFGEGRRSTSLTESRISYYAANRGLISTNCASSPD